MSGISLEELPKTIRKRTQASSVAMTVALAAAGSLGKGITYFYSKFIGKKVKTSDEQEDEVVSN